MTIQDWTRVASADEVKLGRVKGVAVGDDEVALANVDGDFFAVSDICSHEYVLLHDGWIEGHEIECPEHGSRFDLRSGQVANLPATQPVPKYEVKVEGNDVYIKGPKGNGDD